MILKKAANYLKKEKRKKELIKYKSRNREKVGESEGFSKRQKIITGKKERKNFENWEGERGKANDFKKATNCFSKRKKGKKILKNQFEKYRKAKEKKKSENKENVKGRARFAKKENR